MKHYFLNSKISRAVIYCYLLIFGLTTFAQTTTTFPAASSCTSKDLSLVSATLTGGDVCNTCVAGTTLTRNLVLGINNKTGSTRTAFSFWGTLVIQHADGTTTTTQLNRCSGPIPPTGPLPAFYSGGNFGTINYQCGDKLSLQSLFLAWTDASPNSTCASLNSATINPKCGTLPSIVINSGVNGNFVVSGATCTAAGLIAVSPIGGTGPYQVSLGSSTQTNIATGGTATFSNLAAGGYTVTMTDSKGCTFSINKTVGTPTPIAAPSATATQPTCSVATGSASVNSPQSGVTYTLRQANVIKYTAVSGVFNAIASGNYDLVASNGSCSTTGDSVVINSQPQTPGSPTVDVTQPSCTVATGTGNVENPVSGVIYTLRLNGSVEYTAVNGVFSSVAPGTYSAFAYNGVCTSSGSSVTVNPQPQTPSAPTVCIVQPSLCGPSNGTVTILSPTGSGYEYSIDNGTTWQSGAVFSDVVAGSVTGIRAKKNGCVSDAASCSDSNCSVARVASVIPVSEPKADEKNGGAGFDAFPVPFKDQLTVRYNFNYRSAVKIELFDSNGLLLMTKNDAEGRFGKEMVLNLSFSIKKGRVYFVKVSTDRGSNVKTVMASY